MIEVVMVVKHVEARTVRLSPAAAQRRERLSAGGLCLGCEKPVDAKGCCGCCSSCYQAAIYAIRKGQVTREELVRKGLILPARPAGRKPKAGGMAERLRG